MGGNASQQGRGEAETALYAVRGGAREVFGPFLPKPRLPPLSSPVRFKYYLNPPRRFQQRSGSPRSRFAYTCSNSPAQGYPVASEIHTLRAVIRIRAPILSNRSRIVVHCARAIFVPANPSRRSASRTQYPIDEKYNRI